MKKLTFVLGLLVLLGSTGLASAEEGVYVSGPRVAASVTFPGMRLVVGHPGYYCWYGGRYYSRTGWDRFSRLHRDQDRRFDRDRYDHRDLNGHRDHDRS